MCAHACECKNEEKYKGEQNGQKVTLTNKQGKEKKEE
jgi:hypothetical protein